MDEPTMTENEIAQVVVDAAFRIHKGVGPGLLESVYETVLMHELVKWGMRVERQVLIPIRYEGVEITEGFRADLIVNGLLIVELKSIEVLLPVHKKQLLTYLRMADLKLGLLINFGEALFKTGVHRVVNGL